MMYSDFDWNSIPDGSIHCDEARKYFQVKEINGKKVVLSPPEEKLDIFSKTNKTIPKWTPTTEARKIDEFSYVVIDIETTRINNAFKDVRDIAKNLQIKAIGLKSETGAKIYIRDDSERVMLNQLFTILEKKQPDFIWTFRGMYFDLPVIAERAKIYGIRSPFWIDYNRQSSRFASANIAGRYWDVPYRAVHCTFGGKKAFHIDLYMMVVAWDSIMRKLNKYTLKNIPVDLKLRKADDRIDLGMEGLEDCYKNNKWDLLWEYLEDDLDDTELLGKRFVPEILNSKVYFPDFNYQVLATVGVGTKWQNATEKFYSKEYIDSLELSDSMKYQGAITIARSGVHKDVVAIDFSAQYPSCMQMYGIHSEKDPDMAMLQMLQHATDYRMQLKYKEERTGEKPTQAEKDFVTTAKGVINGCFSAITPVITDKGTLPIIDLVGKKTNVWNGKQWSEVEFTSYGVQEIYELILTRDGKTKTIETTANHKWFIQDFDKRYKRGKKNYDIVKTTDQLKVEFRQGRYKGDLIPFRLPNRTIISQEQYKSGIIHGIVYGDGTKHSSNVNRYNISLYSGKKELKKYFQDLENIIVMSIQDKFDDRIADPNYILVSLYSELKLKQLPSLNSSNDYLIGFFRGLFACDGSISESNNSQPSISCDKNCAEYLEKISQRIGLFVTNSYILCKEGTVNISKAGIIATATRDTYAVMFQLYEFHLEDFLRSFHYDNFNSRAKNFFGFKKRHAPWQVLSVKATGVFQEVYCCVEPSRHRFTLADGVLTSNCYGAYASRIPFGDPVAAAMVTAFARARIKWAIRTLTELGGELILTDTDSCIFKTNRIDIHLEHPLSKGTLAKTPDNASPQLLSALAIAEILMIKKPEGSLIDLDGVHGLFFVPPRVIPVDFNKSYKVKSKNGQKFILKELKDEMAVEYALQNHSEERVTFDLLCKISDKFGLGFPDFEAVRKNYLKYTWDHKSKEYSLKAKGKFIKRDRTVLEKQFQQDFIKLYFDSPLSAIEMYNSTRTQIQNRTYPLKNLAVTRKIRIGEVKLIELGFGKPRDTITFYRGENGDPVRLDSGIPYDMEFYLEKIDRLYDEITTFIQDEMI